MINMEIIRKDAKPFEHIYRELLSKAYLYHPNKPLYSPSCKDLYNTSQNNKYQVPYCPINKQTEGADGFSIDSLLSNESEAIGDKIKNNAFAIYDRLKINNEFNYIMTNNWLSTKNRLLELDVNNPYNRNYKTQDRMASMLESQLVSIEESILKEKQKCWSDLLLPMSQFTEYFHKYQQLKQDKKLLE